MRRTLFGLIGALFLFALTSAPAFEELHLALKRARGSERERAAIAEALARAGLGTLRRGPLAWLDGHSPPVGGLDSTAEPLHDQGAGLLRISPGSYACAAAEGPGEQPIRRSCAQRIAET